MRRPLRNILTRLQTPFGRRQLRDGLLRRLWPLLSRVARLHRQTVTRKTCVIAIVGSLGKSTTSRALTTALGLPLHRLMLFNSWSGLALALLRIRPGQRNAVIEVGIAAPGQMDVYARVVRPTVTVVTSIASEHNRSLGSLESTRVEKSRMVRALPRSGTAVLNGDDPHVMWMKGETHARVVTFGFDDTCDVRATDVRLDWPHGTRFHLRAFGEERDVTIQLIGRYMVYPALAAVAVSHVAGIPLDEALSRLRSLTPTPGRMAPVALPNGVILLRDEYKAPLEAMHAALDVVADIPAERRIVVLGDVSEAPGSQGPIYRALGERVARIASLLVVVGSRRNPRGYAAGARRAGMPGSRIISAGPTPREAAETLRKLLQPGDVVLLKGRGTQRLERVGLILQGRRVLCNISDCRIRSIDCAHCPMLERGWGSSAPVA